MEDSRTLEELLNERESRIYQVKTIKEDRNYDKSVIQTADKSATLFDFIKMVQKFVDITMKDLSVEFIPDENKKIAVDADIQLDHPVITYKVITRKPKNELKPRTRQTIREELDDENNERYGDIYGQKFTCLIQFNVFASVYDIAEQVMEKFEEMIFTYTGFFKKNGVSELFFSEQLTDEYYDIFRQTLSVRNVRYYVEVEKLHVLFSEKIKDIETLALE